MNPVRKTASILSKTNLAIFALFFFGSIGVYYYKTSVTQTQLLAEKATVNFAKETLALPLLSDTSVILKQFIKTEPTEYRVLILVDGGCSVCFQEFVYWNDLSKKNKIEKRKIIFFGYGASFETLNFISKKVPLFELPIFIDTYYRFGKSNKIDPNGTKKVFLVDSKNNIILKGDPSKDPSLENIYLSYLTKI